MSADSQREFTDALLQCITTPQTYDDWVGNQYTIARSHTLEFWKLNRDVLLSNRRFSEISATDPWIWRRLWMGDDGCSRIGHSGDVVTMLDDLARAEM